MAVDCARLYIDHNGAAVFHSIYGHLYFIIIRCAKFPSEGVLTHVLKKIQCSSYSPSSITLSKLINKCSLVNRCCCAVYRLFTHMHKTVLYGLGSHLMDCDEIIQSTYNLHSNHLWRWIYSIHFQAQCSFRVDTISSNQCALNAGCHYSTERHGTAQHIPEDFNTLFSGTEQLFDISLFLFGTVELYIQLLSYISMLSTLFSMQILIVSV